MSSVRSKVDSRWEQFLLTAKKYPKVAMLLQKISCEHVKFLRNYISKFHTFSWPDPNFVQHCTFSSKFYVCFNQLFLTPFCCCHSVFWFPMKWVSTSFPRDWCPLKISALHLHSQPRWQHSCYVQKTAVHYLHPILPHIIRVSLWKVER